MKCAAGIWFPDSEQHLVKMVELYGTRVDGKGTYQLQKLQAALQHVRQWRCAVDVGMHVGLWAMHLTKKFNRVVGFEPVADHIECLQRNMEGIDNWEVHDCALGAHDGSVGLRFLEGSTGSTHINPAQGGNIRMRSLDEFDLRDVGLIKIDVEGYEKFVVQGAEQTIRKQKPVIIVEQKGGKCQYYGHSQYDARDLLLSWGGKQKFDMSGDCCIVW